MNDDKPPFGKYRAYWQPSLTGLVQQSDRTSIKSILLDIKIFSVCIFRFSKRKVIFLIRKFLTLIINFLEIRQFIRDYVLKKLLTRRGYLFRPTSHAAVLSLTLAVMLSGGAGANIILGQGVAQGDDIFSGSDVLAEVVTPETEVPEDRPSEQKIEYEVVDGDTLTSIGEKFRVSIESIRYANNLANIHALKIGQKLIIPPVSGVIVKVKEGDTVESLAKKYAVSPQVIVDFNYLEEPFTLIVDQEVTIPDAKIPAPPPPKPVVPSPGYVATAPPSGVSGTGQFVWPTNIRYITQYFRSYHPALDIAKESPIYAADGGTVIEAAYGGWNYGYGKYVKIDHGNGYTTMYAHMAEVHVSPGDVVSRGQSIGQMGNTGRSFGTHLHFVVQYNGQYINPLSVF